ncbi:MAG: type I restriction enzyme HsdR N-terminal domain-containing protein [Chitinophagaceae bacterium]|nr:type I restriction enzyme HsdR N-terminal domain-containing protein [Chitinophagaceae bacterium]
MKLNKFLWNNYKETEQGKKAIELFTNGTTIDILLTYFKDDVSQDTIDFIDDLTDFSYSPKPPQELTKESAENLFNEIVKNGFSIKKENEEIEEFKPDRFNFLHIILTISTWLYYKYPDFFKPYFYISKFQLLTQIADTFSIELPEVPLKRYKEERIRYYWKLCEVFQKFQSENEMTAFEFCAFLYDFAPNYINQTQVQETELPQATQVWLVGGDQGGNDFEFLDNYQVGNTSFWQGNVDTKRGDIIIMYCLSPRSCIHSIWRATKDGIADPFFHYYSSIYISEGIKVEPISINELKSDAYFSKHPLVRKNLQGVSGYSFTSEDYNRLLHLVEKKGTKINLLPQLYSPTFSSNGNLEIERDVEIQLIEPLLKELGYTEKHWERQLTVRMGRGERNFPDYAFLTNKEKNYEIASMLIEAKFWIKNNKELEETFKQVYSYGLRLSAKFLVIADKDAIWIYEKYNDSFDRTKYIKKFWKELEQPDEFNYIKKMIGRK